MRHFRLETWVFLGMIALIIGSLFNAKITPDKTVNTPIITPAKEPESEASILNTARGACAVFVKKQLNDPDSAQFEDSRRFWAKKEKNGIYHAFVELRAKNGFGALMKGTFDCKVTQSNGNWFLVYLKEII